MVTQSNMYILNDRKTIIGVISNSLPQTLPFYDDIQTRDLDDYTNSLTFSVPANHTDAHLIIAGGYVLYPSADDEFQLFKIMSTTESHAEGKYSKKIYCEISAQDDLIKDVVRPTSFSSASLKDVLTSVLAGSDWEVGNVEDFGVKDYKIDDYPTKLKAVIDAVAEYGGELNFEYSMLKSSVTINSQKVSAYKQLGTVTNKLFTYGIDIEGVERTEDVSKLITAVVVVGKSDSDSTPITIANIPVSQLGDLPEGYEKPTAGDWVGSQTAVQNYSPTGKHIFGVYKDNEARSPAELFANALEVLKQYSRPQMTYKVSVALLSELTGYEVHKVAIGDTIVVQDVTLNPALYISARIRQFNRSISDPTQSTVELGDYIPIVPSINQTVQQLQSTIRDKEETWDTAKTQAEDAIDAANRAEQSASEAGAKADEAKALVDDLSNDDKLFPVEKKTVKKEIGIISAEKLLNDAQAQNFGITTELTAYDSAYDTLLNYVAPLLSDMNNSSDIDGNTFRANFIDYYNKRTDLLNAISTKAKAIADSKITSDQATTISQDPDNVKVGFNGILATVYIDSTGLHVQNGEITGDIIKGGTITGSTLRTSSGTDYMTVHDQYMEFYKGGQRKIAIGYNNTYTQSVSLFDSNNNEKLGLYIGREDQANKLCSNIEYFRTTPMFLFGLSSLGGITAASLRSNGSIDCYGNLYMNDNLINTNGGNIIMGGGTLSGAILTGVGKNPAWTQSVSILTGNSVTVYHGLGYHPIVRLSGTVGNLIVTTQDQGLYSTRVYVYSGGGGTFNGYVYFY
ncbi:putative tail fiber protein [Clostridium phage vB_CtyS-FA67]|nr:putative tail fiber protein [Clostridium phage vB_CtyS-FA67]